MSMPPELNDLSKILLRFRLNHFAITTDIEKALLHVGLCEEDRNVTHFLWLSHPSDVRSQLSLFGARCSPFILNAILLKQLRKSENKTAKLLEQDLYVDNILSSISNKDNALPYF